MLNLLQMHLPAEKDWISCMEQLAKYLWAMVHGANSATVIMPGAVPL